MKPEAWLADETRRWLAQAQQDLQAAELLRRNGLLRGALFQAVSRLTGYAVRTRYPGAGLDPDDSEAGDAVALARTAYSEILMRLPETVRP